MLVFLENFGNVLNEWSLRKLFWAISQCVPIVSFWNDWSKATYSYEVLSAIWYHLYNFKNEKNTQGFFSRFLNWKNGNKSCKAFHMFLSFFKTMRGNLPRVMRKFGKYNIKQIWKFIKVHKGSRSLGSRSFL